MQHSESPHPSLRPSDHPPSHASSCATLNPLLILLPPVAAAVGIFASFNKESVKDKLLLEPGEKVSTAQHSTAQQGSMDGWRNVYACMQRGDGERQAPPRAGGEGRSGASSIDVYAYIYMCVYLCMCVCIHLCVCISMCVCICMYPITGCMYASPMTGD